MAVGAAGKGKPEPDGTGQNKNPHKKHGQTNPLRADPEKKNAQSHNLAAESYAEDLTVGGIPKKSGIGLGIVGIKIHDWVPLPVWLPFSGEFPPISAQTGQRGRGKAVGSGRQGRVDRSA